jgi:high affinity choline transporter 7
MLLGLAGRAIDWGQVAAANGGMATAGAEAIEQSLAENGALVLPYLLRFAVPEWVAVLGLGAISAAVMSSVDSSILSASSLVAWNGYRRLFKPDVDTAEVTRLVRVLVVLFGTASTVIALSVGSVASLWYLCGDVVYCVLFPQLAMALFDPKANRLGAVTGFLTSVFLRIGGGDETLGLPAFLGYPSWGEDGQAFPFRTLAMLAGLAAALTVSRLTQRYDPPRELRAME